MAADPTDPYKQQENLHKSATDVAKAVSDAYYKVDTALLSLPAGNTMAAQMKAVRDNLFVQKQQAETILQAASEALANTPQPPPEPPKAPEAPAAAPAPAPAAAPTASKKAGEVPTQQAETIGDLLKKGQPGEAGKLATDGKVITLAGKSIMKVENGKVFASWGGDPSMVTASNLNSLGVVLGVGRIAQIKDGHSILAGKPSGPKVWAQVGSIPVTARKRAGIPPLLCPKL